MQSLVWLHAVAINAAEAAFLDRGEAVNSLHVLFIAIGIVFVHVVAEDFYAALRLILAIPIADFIKYKSECDPEASAIRLSGILSLHLLSGRGLRTGGRSRRIRDLYCVVEVDHIHKARTVVRSGGVNFDWDEK